MCYRCGMKLGSHMEGKHFCCSLRDEFESYDVCSDCYKGGYTFGQPADAVEGKPPDDDKKIYAIGTWNGWSEYLEMEKDASGAYVLTVPLGDNRWEQFRLATEKSARFEIYPPVKKAGSAVRAVGPDKDVNGRAWCIDGRGEGVPAGTLYQIVFRWDKARRTVTWRRAPETGTHSLPEDYLHKYFVVGDWLNWQMQEMKPGKQEIQGIAEPHTTSFR